MSLDLSFVDTAFGSEPQVVLDMSRVRWLHPAHLVAAAAVADARARDGVMLEVRGPGRSDQLRYAARMRLGRVLSGSGVRHNFPHVRERDRQDDLLEVRRIRSEQDACRLAELVQAKVHPENARASRELYACVVEMALNVADHAAAVGFVAAQTMPSRGVIRFAVADAGVGLRGTLSVRGAGTDEDALRMALQGVSRFGDDASHGTGMPSTRSTLLRTNGQMFVVSGEAASLESSTGSRRTTLSSPVPGTVIQGTLRMRGSGR